MSDLFGGDDRYADLLARLEALESIVYQTQKAERSKVDEPLNEAWQLWNRHRNGKGWTAEAKKLNMRKLRELAGTDGELALKIVQRSMEMGWAGLFPLPPPDSGSRSFGRTASQEAPSAVQTKTVAQALAPSETKEERDRAYRLNLERLGVRQ